MEIMGSFGQIRCVTLYAKLACQQQRLRLIDKMLSKNPWKEEKRFKNMIAL